MSFDGFAALFSLSDSVQEYGLGGSGVDGGYRPIVY